MDDNTFKCAVDLIRYSTEELENNKEFCQEISDMLMQPGMPETVAFLTDMSRLGNFMPEDIIGIITLSVYLYKSTKKFNDAVGIK